MMGINVPSNFEADEIADFSIRKEYVNKCKKTGVFTSRRFMSRLVIVLNRDSKKCVVSEFIAEHNHYLHISSTVHMMPSQRKVAATHAIEIDLAHESGLRLKQSYELLSKQQDHKNYLRTKRQRDMEHGAAASLGRYFNRQLKENPSYYFATQLDCEDLITNIFWADARMIIDYSHFGDVITFDTTYSTNRDARPLGVFLGLNHHREIVVFGGALLYDETIESLVWLFEIFLEAMSEKKPITIFIDQDAAMSAAIKVVMPKTYHALCSWHMWQNVEKHLGHLLKNDSQFNADFLACIYEYDGEDEFLTAWNEMLDKYNFFTHFETVVNQKRDKELEAEYNSRQKFPRLKLKSSPMLNQVATVYTPKLFDLFQTEVEEVMALSILEHNVSQTHSYVVGVFNQYGKYEVMWNPLDETLSCSCRKFESFGILCRHGLKVLDVLDIKLIPNRYIMKRWRRDVKDGSRKNCTTHNIKPNTRLEYVYRYRDLCPKYIQLVNEACETKEDHNILSLAIADLKKKLCDLRGCKANVEEDIIRPSTDFADKEYQLCASITIVPKGIKKKEVHRNKKRRTKSWIEKMRKPKEGTSKKQTKKRKVRAEIYAHNIMAQKKTEDIFSENITSFTQLLMFCITSGRLISQCCISITFREYIKCCRL
ncbi:hypothetical protein RGQ29_019930 [Quercus rubra]|uniref:Protein FAR1-RELATED SEQUENCE n=1 Tax=Quercus rubra TaxID=3512 RepID=A0AAN7IX08_QUERU|nr:hypothetical protein RGQ29_019930 [Quercus rubra]